MNKEIEERIEEKKLEMTKLRFTNGKGREKYLESLKTREAVLILKARLNMLELKCNYKSKHKDMACQLCGVENETTEHLFLCSNLRKANWKNLTIADLINPNKNVAEYITEVLNLRKLGCRIDAAGANSD